jgi:hypothetical protein
VAFIEIIQQQSFWDLHVHQIGPAVLKPYPLIQGRRHFPHSPTNKDGAPGVPTNFATISWLGSTFDLEEPLYNPKISMLEYRKLRKIELQRRSDARSVQEAFQNFRERDLALEQRDRDWFGAPVLDAGGLFKTDERNIGRVREYEMEFTSMRHYLYKIYHEVALDTMIYWVPEFIVLHWINRVRRKQGLKAWGKEIWARFVLYLDDKKRFFK